MADALSGRPGTPTPSPNGTQTRSKSWQTCSWSICVTATSKTPALRHTPPPLLTLAAAVTHADLEHARQKRRQRVTRQHGTQASEPMEVGAVMADAIPLREEMRKMRAEMSALRRETAALRRACNPATLTAAPAPAAPVPPVTYKRQNTHGAPKNGSAGTRACYECGAFGHFGRDCARRADRLANGRQGN